MSRTLRRDIHNSDLPVPCRACEARHKGICGALSEEELVELSRSTVRRRLSAGDTLRRAGDKPLQANILSGVVKLTRLLADGRQQITGLQFAPDFMGRTDGARGRGEAEAATAVELCAFPLAALEAMIARSPDLGGRLYAQAVRELDGARDWIVTLGRKSAAEKVASFLMLLADHVDPDAPAEGPRRLELPLSRADIADFLGLTVETVSRQITALRKSGVIALEGSRTLLVPDPARLRRAAGD